MAKQSDGPKGQPRFDANAAPEVGTDENIVSDYAADVGNTKIRNTAGRLALAGVERWDGLLCIDTDLRRIFIWDAPSSSWKDSSVFGDTGWQPLTLNTGWTPQSPDVIEYRVADGWCSLVGRVDATAGASTLALTLPVGARPTRPMAMHIQDTSGTAVGFVVTVNGDGTIVVFKGSNAVNDLPLSAIPSFRVV